MVVGEVLEWKGKYGWIQPLEPFDHPKARMRNGRIFVSRTDLASARELAPGTLCHFYVFEDEAGLGAEECVASEQPPQQPPQQPQQQQQRQMASAPRLPGQWAGRGGGGRRGRGVSQLGRGRGGDEFSLPGYVKLQAQAQAQAQVQAQVQVQPQLQSLPMGRGEDELSSLQAGIRNLQLGPQQRSLRVPPPGDGGPGWPTGPPPPGGGQGMNITLGDLLGNPGALDSLLGNPGGAPNAGNAVQPNWGAFVPPARLHPGMAPQQNPFGQW